MREQRAVAVLGLWKLGVCVAKDWPCLLHISVIRLYINAGIPLTNMDTLCALWSVLYWRGSEYTLTKQVSAFCFQPVFSFSLSLSLSLVIDQVVLWTESSGVEVAFRDGGKGQDEKTSVDEKQRASIGRWLSHFWWFSTLPQRLF